MTTDRRELPQTLLESHRQERQLTVRGNETAVQTVCEAYSMPRSRLKSIYFGGNAITDDNYSFDDYGTEDMARLEATVLADTRRPTEADFRTLFPINKVDRIATLGSAASFIL